MFVKGQGPSVPLPLDFLGGIFAANVDARKKLMIRFEIEFKNEIIEAFFRAKNAVGFAFGNGFADDAAILRVESGVAGFLGPTRKVFAVEQVNPVLPGQKFWRDDQAQCK